MFRSFDVFNYRLWVAGAFVSNIGSWMQRAAQDWLVLTGLTHHSATAVGIVLALQFGPQVLLLPLTGLAADTLDRRKLVMATQAAMGVLALCLGILTVSGLVQLWQVYVFAFLLGCATAFDSPARQTFVSDLVDGEDLSNAVALNSTSFNIARLIGPAVAGLLIASVGTGWVFLINAASFGAVLGSLALLRVSELHTRPRRQPAPGDLVDGFRYVWGRPDLRAIMVMLFLVGTFGMNFPIFLSTMSVTVFHAGAGAYGFLTSAMAIGSVSGALLAARRARPRIVLLLGGAALFGVGLALAAAMPTYWAFALALVVVGVSAQTLTTTANSTVQLSTDPAMRGRVMAILLAVVLGGTPVGAPFAGWVADSFGPRWAIAVGGAAGLAAAAVGASYLVKYQHLRLHRDRWRVHLSLNESGLITEPQETEVATTTLDTQTALVVVDLQNGVAALPTAHPVAEVVEHASALADAFRSHGLPVVLVNVDGGAAGRTEAARSTVARPDGWTDLLPELNRQPEDHMVTKRTWGAFTNTDLAEHLDSLGVTQVVIVGVATSLGVESTARQAHEHGFNVTLAVDAMTDMSPDAHANSISRIFPRLGETGTTAEIIALLGTTAGREVAQPR